MTSLMRTHAPIPSSRPTVSIVSNLHRSWITTHALKLEINHLFSMTKLATSSGFRLYSIYSTWTITTIRVIILYDFRIKCIFAGRA